MPRTPVAVVAAILLAASAAVGLGGADADAVPPGENGEIAFASARDGVYEIYAVRPDGSGERRVTTLTSQDTDPAWAPGGARIALSRTMQGRPAPNIWTMNPDGSGRVRLTSESAARFDREPAWSPDGTRIAWGRSVGPTGTGHIWVMHADGSGKLQLTNGPAGSFAASPAWSPDGTRIAFVSNRAGGFAELYDVDADGSGLRRLSTNGWAEGNPTWSPDGTRIAFERWVGGTSNLWVRDMTTGAESQLTTTPGLSEVSPAWAPDGSAIAYTRFPAGGGAHDVYTLNLSTMEHTRLTSSGRADVGPDWQSLDPGADVFPGTGAASLGGEESVGGGAAFVEGGLAKPRYSKRGKNLIDGVRFIRITDRKGPKRIFVLRIDPRGPATMDLALGKNRLPGFQRTSRMAGKHNAIAAINGDFPVPSNGRPSHPFALDGELIQTSFAAAESFAVAADESETFFGRPVERVVVEEEDSGDVWWAHRWNEGTPTFAEAGGFTARAGALERPPDHACSARLVAAGGFRWAPNREGVRRDHVVDAVSCGSSPLTRGAGLVLSSPPGSSGGHQIASLSVGEIVGLTWTFGWAGVADSMGGIPLLLRDGARAVAPCDESLCRRHPRTGIGMTPAGKLLLVVVDGRRKLSKGVTLSGFVRLFRDLGATWALNLDGGGSSTMFVRGKVRNVPSDGRERRVCCSVLVLRGPDPGEVIGEDGGPTAVSGGGSPRRIPAPGRRAALDPASTGGMVDALDSGLFGGGTLPPELRRALRLFRSG